MIQLNQDKVKEEPVDHEEEEPIINNDIIVASVNLFYFCLMFENDD
mgnify:CR=1 FL=1